MGRATFEKNHSHCADCERLVLVETMVNYPWGRRRGQTRIRICKKCAENRRTDERRQKVADMLAPKAKAELI